jgi:hypothetical protein
MIADYDGLYRNAYKHLLPGGWFEVRDHDLQFFVDTQGGDEEKEGTGSEGTEGKLVLLRRWEKLMAEAAEKFGKPINMGAKHKEMMEQAGFTDVHEKVFQVCLNLLFRNLAINSCLCLVHSTQAKCFSFCALARSHLAIGREENHGNT